MRTTIVITLITIFVTGCKLVEQANTINNSISLGNVPAPPLLVPWVYQNNDINEYNEYNGSQGLCLSAVIESWERWENNTQSPTLDYNYQTHTPSSFSYTGRYEKSPYYLTKYMVWDRMEPVLRPFKTYRKGSMPSAVKFLKDNPRVLNNIEVIGTVDSFERTMNGIYNSLYKIEFDIPKMYVDSSPAILLGSGTKVDSPQEGEPHAILITGMNWNTNLKGPVSISYLNPNQWPEEWYGMTNLFEMPKPDKQYTDYPATPTIRRWAEYQANWYNHLTGRTTLAIMRKPNLTGPDQLSDVSEDIESIQDLPYAFRESISNDAIGGRNK